MKMEEELRRTGRTGAREIKEQTARDIRRSQSQGHVGIPSTSLTRSSLQQHHPKVHRSSLDRHQPKAEAECPGDVQGQELQVYVIRLWSVEVALT